MLSNAHKSSFIALQSCACAVQYTCLPDLNATINNLLCTSSWTGQSRLPKLEPGRRPGEKMMKSGSSSCCIAGEEGVLDGDLPDLHICSHSVKKYQNQWIGITSKQLPFLEGDQQLQRISPMIFFFFTLDQRCTNTNTGIGTDTKHLHGYLYSYKCADTKTDTDSVHICCLQ